MMSQMPSVIKLCIFKCVYLLEAIEMVKCDPFAQRIHPVIEDEYENAFSTHIGSSGDICEVSL